MKKYLLIGLLALGSISAFAAAPKSEFERGYDAGKQANQSENAYICKPILDGGVNIPRSVGLSRGDAIQNLFHFCANGAFVTNRIDCINAIETEKITCTKL